MNGKVLLVEDDVDYREVIHLNLELRGFEVITAADGEAAVETAKKQAPDIVLMDLKLPVLDGVQATRRIKRDEATERIPVIVFSAHCWDFETKQKVLSAGALACLKKPLDFDRLPVLIAPYALHDAARKIEQNQLT